MVAHGELRQIAVRSAKEEHIAATHEEAAS